MLDEELDCRLSAINIVSNVYIRKRLVEVSKRERECVFLKLYFKYL